jgi:hypothetical protein
MTTVPPPLIRSAKLGDNLPAVPPATEPERISRISGDWRNSSNISEAPKIDAAYFLADANTIIEEQKAVAALAAPAEKPVEIPNAVPAEAVEPVEVSR